MILNNDQITATCYLLLKIWLIRYKIRYMKWYVDGSGCLKDCIKSTSLIGSTNSQQPGKIKIASPASRSAACGQKYCFGLDSNSSYFVVDIKHPPGSRQTNALGHSSTVLQRNFPLFLQIIINWQHSIKYFRRLTHLFPSTLVFVVTTIVTRDALLSTGTIFIYKSSEI